MSAPDPRSPLLSVSATAEALSVSEKTVRRLIGRGEIPAVRVGHSVRVDPDELCDWLFRDVADGAIVGPTGPAGGTESLPPRPPAGSYRREER